MKATITMALFAGLVLSKGTAFAGSCDYDKMSNYALSNSAIAETYGEAVKAYGGPSMGSGSSTYLVADLIGESGRRELNIVVCDESTGHMYSTIRSIRTGRVVFDQK